MAVLSWTGSDAVSDYIVEVKAFGTDTWQRLARFHAAMGTGKDTMRGFSLDSFYNLPTMPDGGRLHGGLADHPGLIFRVKAVDSQGESDYSEEIIMIDTPIVTVNGHSPGTDDNTGRAEVGWLAVPSILGDSTLDNGAYSFRYRRTTGNHSQLGWRPNSFDLDASVAASSLRDGRTITGLTRQALYAIQIIYAAPSGRRVYAARDSYVWPSGTAANFGQRVGTFPLTFPVNNPSYKDGNPHTYAYRICEDGFSDPDESGRLRQWKILIQHALGQWQLATNGLIEIDYVGADCSNYSRALKAVRDELTERKLSEEHAIAFLTRLDFLTNIQTDDTERSEIMMVNDLSGIYVDLKSVLVFPEVSQSLGIASCIFPQDPPPAAPPAEAVPCVRPPGFHPDSGTTTDILLPKSRYFSKPKGQPKPTLIVSLDIPGGSDPADFDPADADIEISESYTVNRGDAPFNYCPNDLASGPRWNLTRGRVHPDRPYMDLVHESGHALGLRGGFAGSKWIPQMHGHPSVAGSVVNYNREILQYEVNGIRLLGEPDCSPHPFDVMAMFALYQSL